MHPKFAIGSRYFTFHSEVSDKPEQEYSTQLQFNQVVIVERCFRAFRYVFLCFYSFFVTWLCCKNMKKGYKVTDVRREKKIGVAAENLEELIEKSYKKLGVSCFCLCLRS